MLNEWRGQRRIADSGPQNARIIIIGEAGGIRERAALTPFVGPAGWKLDAWLGHAQLRRSDCYITNVFPFQPDANKIKSVPKADLEAAISELHDRLAELAQPYVLVPTGNTPLQALTGRPAANITTARGFIERYTDRRGRDIKVIPTIHPAAIFRTPYWERRCLLDWEKIALEAQSPAIDLPTWEHFVTPTIGDLQSFLEDARQRADVLSIDIETFSGVIDCVGFGYEADFSMTIPTTLRYWSSQAQLDEAWRIVRELCALPCRKAMQYGFFDAYWLLDERCPIINWTLDTMALHHAIDAADDHDLGYMASTNLRMPSWKHIPKDDDARARYPSDAHAVRVYNGIDVCVQWQLADLFEKRLATAGRLPFYRSHYVDLFQPLLRLMRHGVATDNAARAERFAELRSDCTTLTSELNALAGRDLCGKLTSRHKKLGVDPTISNKKLSTYFYDVLKLPKQIKRETGKLTTDEVAIRKIMLAYQRKITAALATGRRSGPDLPLSADVPQICAVLLEHRRKKKLSEFLDAGRLDRDGRMRSSYGFSPECLAPDAEALTLHGWVQLSKLLPGTPVAQWSSDGQISFDVPRVRSWPYRGPVVVAKAHAHRNVYTPNHRIPALPYDGEFREYEAADAARLAHFRLPVSGQYEGGLHDPAFIRFVVACQADGSVADNGIVFSLKKRRKIARLCALSRTARIPIVRRKTQKGFARFYVRVQHARRVLEWISGTKREFNDKLLTLDGVSLDAFIDELKHWDGSAHFHAPHAFAYFTTSRRSADWVQTIAHLRKWHAMIHIKRPAGPVTIGGRTWQGARVYLVYAAPGAHRQSMRKHYSTRSYHGRVWCLTTTTGFFLCRYHDRVVVTGNTGRLSSSKNPCGTGANAQNQDREIRNIFVPDDGCVFAEIDTSQGEDRIVKALIASLLSDGPRRDELLWRARAQPHENDEHLRAASIIFNVSQDQVTTAPNGGQRYIGKRARHASSYDMHGKRLSEEVLKDGITITPDEGQRMIEAIVDRDIPELRDWQCEIRKRLLRDRKLTNGWGRELLFTYDRLDEDAYRRGYAFIPQSSLATLLNQWGFVPLDAAIVRGDVRAAINVNNHDSLLVSVRPDDVWDVWQFLRTSLERPATYWGVELTIPVTLKCGLNWAFNPGIEFKKPPCEEELREAIKQLEGRTIHV